MRKTVLLVPFLGLSILGCSDDGSDADSGLTGQRSLSQSLTESVRFPDDDIVQQLLPDPSSTMRLSSLSDDTAIRPGQDGMMSLQIDGTPDQDAIQTLIEFSVPGQDASEGQGSHIVVPVPDDQRGTLIENPFSVSADLCDDACDAVFEVEVRQAVRFEGGAISQPVVSTLIVDCLQAGSADNCRDDDPVVDTCGDASEAELVYTGVRSIDSLFGAARRLAKATDDLSDRLSDVLGELGRGLDMEGAGAMAISDAFGARVADNTDEGGLQMLLGEQGCAVPVRSVTRGLDACEDTPPELEAIGCEGECRVRADSRCTAAAEARCRGLLDGEVCEGSCTGSCTVSLSEAGPCNGTCIGSCSGECPAGEDEDCEGPCNGDCTGECREPLDGSCDGTCAGLCDQAGSGGCDGKLAQACISSEVADCADLCFGVASLDEGGSELCRAAAMASARARPFCEPTLVQLSFGFAEGLEPDAQADFAAWVTDLNTTLVDLYEVLAVAERLGRGGDELDRVQSEQAQDAIADAMQGDGGAGLECAMQQLEGMGQRLEDDLMRLGEAQADGAALLGPIMPQ